MAKIYPLDMHPDVALAPADARTQRAPLPRNIWPFLFRPWILPPRLGGSTPRGLKVMQRAYALLTEAKSQFEREFDQ